MQPTSETRAALQAQIDRLTGTKQPEQVKQALRFARGAMRSTLATERELREWLAKLSAI